LGALDMQLETATPIRRLMLNGTGAVAQFEGERMVEQGVEDRSSWLGFHPSSAASSNR
jgi:hypothetical protein